MKTWALKGTISGVGGGNGGGNGSGVSNFISKITAGISQQVVGDFGRVLVSVGVSVAQAVTRLTVPQTIGISISHSASGDAVRSPQTVGVDLDPISSGGSKFPVSVGAELIQAFINLTQTTYAISAASTGTWTNPNNGNGPNNGVFATNANTLTAAASGTVTYSFATQLNKTDLTISDVQLGVFWKYVAGGIGPGTYKAEYSFDGTIWNNWKTGSASFDNSVTPDVVSMTALVAGDWSKLSGFKMRFTHTAAAGATPSTLSVDAVRLIVTASRIDQL